MCSARAAFAALLLLLLPASALIVPVPPSCTPSGTCVAAIAAAFAACAASRDAACTIQLEAGTYALAAPAYATLFAVAPAPAQALAFVGRGDATLLQLADIGTLFSVTGGAAGVRFEGFAVDQLRVPFTYGQVTAVNADGSSDVTFDARGLYAIDAARYPWLLRAQSVLSYDPAKSRVAANATDIYALDAPLPLAYASSTGAAAVVRVGGARLQLGGFVILRHQVYSFNAFNFYGTRGVAVVDVSLFCVGGMGVFTDSAHGIAIAGLSIRKLPGRPMSITADGVHFSNTLGGGVSITDSLFEGQGDDGINIPTIFQEIVWVGADGRSFRVQGRGQAPAAPPLAGAGATVNFFNRTDQALLGTGVVARVDANNTVVLAGALPAGAGVYSLINNNGMQADWVTVVNNTFRNNRARGALLKSSNVWCAYNTFDGCSLSAVKTETDACYWYEGHPVTNWTLFSNVFHEVRGRLPLERRPYAAHSRSLTHPPSPRCRSTFGPAPPPTAATCSSTTPCPSFAAARRRRSASRGRARAALSCSTG
jgi:hypothetical protein